MVNVTRYDLNEDPETGDVFISPVPETMEGRYVAYEDYAVLQQKLDALAAENASMMALAIACEKEFGSYTAEEFPDDVKVSFPEDKCHITFGMIRNALNKTATDAYLKSVRADSVEDAAKRLFGQGYTFEVLTRFAAQLRAGKDGE